MPYQLPDDVVAIDLPDKTLMFYVYANHKGSYQLSYLESPDQFANGDYTAKKIKRAKDPWDSDPDSQMRDIEVSPNNTQVAAITWQGNAGLEIRVYYVQKGNGNVPDYLREICKTGNSGWYIGALSYKDGISNKYQVRPGTSISATVHGFGGDNYNLRVFAAEKDEVNEKGLHSISVFKFARDESGKAPTWQGMSITNTINEY